MSTNFKAISFAEFMTDVMGISDKQYYEMDADQQRKIFDQWHSLTQLQFDLWSSKVN